MWCWMLPIIRISMNLREEELCRFGCWNIGNMRNKGFADRWISCGQKRKMKIIRYKYTGFSGTGNYFQRYYKRDRRSGWIEAGD